MVKLKKRDINGKVMQYPTTHGVCEAIESDIIGKAICFDSIKYLEKVDE